MIFRLKPAHILSHSGDIDLKPMYLRKNRAVIVFQLAISDELPKLRIAGLGALTNCASATARGFRADLSAGRTLSYCISDPS
jgi:hypothetical protein